MTSSMLDTNIASHLIKVDRPELAARVVAVPMEELMISAVTEAELLYGLSRRGYPPALTERVREFLLRVDVLPWDHDVTRSYADLHAGCEAKGIVLAPLDMMIAAHAVACQSILVTRGKAFARVGAPLEVQDWTSAES
jgi:tRNA(fMet)-specific endonuclease VapC